MAMIEYDEMMLVKPRRLITVMNLLSEGPLPISHIVPHEETIKAKKCGIDLGFIEIDFDKKMVYLTSDGYSWLLRNNKVL
jgi:hypothetical protein